MGPFDDSRPGRGGTTLTSLYDGGTPARDTGAPPSKFYGVEAHEHREQRLQQQASLLQQQQQQQQLQGQEQRRPGQPPPPQQPLQWQRQRSPSPPPQRGAVASPHAPASGVHNTGWAPNLTEESMYYDPSSQGRRGGGGGGREEDGVVSYPAAGSRADGVVKYPAPQHSDSLEGASRSSQHPCSAAAVQTCHVVLP